MNSYLSPQIIFRPCTTTSAPNHGIHRHLGERTGEDTMCAIPKERPRGSFYTLAAIHEEGQMNTIHIYPPISFLDHAHQQANRIIVFIVILGRGQGKFQCTLYPWKECGWTVEVDSHPFPAIVSRPCPLTSVRHHSTRHQTGEKAKRK